MTVPDLAQPTNAYVLGPQDELGIWALGVEELSDKAFRVDPSGFVDLPIIGRLTAGGLTVEQFKADLAARLLTEVRNPQVSVTVKESRSQPVSVLGSVGTPGVHQINGGKTLIEVVSLAGGLRPDAGNSIKITRQTVYGRIPLSTSTYDKTGKFSVAEVKVKSIMDASNPNENILIMPNDVVSVPRADLVYVVGEIVKSGGFVLNEKEDISVLQALALAGGLSRNAAPEHARILRHTTKGDQKVELAVNVKRILAGKAADVPMQSDDILFIPNSTAKSVTSRVLEAGINIGSGVLIFRR
jgi:polysaccharide export outer membrane protein